MNFTEFKKLHQRHLKEMYKSDSLFIANINKDKIWEIYLESFPEGTNKVFRERREYDCQCCRQFIRSFGGVVAIKNYKIVTIWDFKTNDNKYQVVIDAMSKYVKEQGVRDFFVTKENSFGTDKNRELKDKIVQTWEHFYTEVPSKLIDTSAKSVGSVMGSLRDSRNVFERSLNEITLDAIETVLDLISQKSLYKGDEWRSALSVFLKVHKAYHLLTETERKLYCWNTSKEMGSISKIKNHSIGVLLTDISEEMDLNQAVKRYENIVAPHNYKRPKAIFTKKMIQQAQDKITDLGYVESLGRRFANIQDIGINDILFADKDSAKQMSGIEGIFEDMKTESVSIKNFDNIEEIPVEHFVSDVLPRLTGLQVMFENKHEQNLMSVIAPKNESKTMFKWDNNFSWAYNGNITDSAMKRRVKAAGGNIDSVLRFSIQWNDVESGDNNQNDFDAHCKEPSGNHIHYPNKGRIHQSTGMLDVDIVNPGSEIAVENITWTNKEKMQHGEYHLYVHNYSHCGGRTGFTAEIEFDGQIYSFVYDKELRQDEKVTVAKIKFDENGFKFIESLRNTVQNKKIWSLKTNTFHPVSVCMFSPNYWENQTGNKHYFFILKSCINEECPNGFFNEFLKPELVEHKRVFEALGSKMKVEQSEDQLSGVGFSSTKRSSIVCKLQGHVNRVIRVIF